MHISETRRVPWARTRPTTAPASVGNCAGLRMERHGADLGKRVRPSARAPRFADQLREGCGKTSFRNDLRSIQQPALTCGFTKCPRQDSNLRHRLRRAVLYPLSYGGGDPPRLAAVRRRMREGTAPPDRDPE